MDGAEAEELRVVMEGLLAAREGVVKTGGVGAGHLPRQQAAGNGHHSVNGRVALVELCLPHWEGQHTGVLGAHVLGKGEALLNVFLDVFALKFLTLVPVTKKEAVAARNVAGARHVAKYEHVLWPAHAATRPPGA